MIRPDALLVDAVELADGLDAWARHLDECPDADVSRRVMVRRAAGALRDLATTWDVER